MFINLKIKLKKKIKNHKNHVDNIFFPHIRVVLLFYIIPRRTWSNTYHALHTV